MNPGATAGAAAATNAAAIAAAIKASGTIVKVKPKDFRAILGRVESPLVVFSEGGFLKTTYSYLTSYKGLAFYTRTQSAMELPGTVEVVKAEKIWIP